MKDTIEYYYSLKIDKLFVEKDVYHFIIEKTHYYFSFFNKTEKDLNDILRCISDLHKLHIYCHEIVINIKGNYLTKIDNQNYLLFKVNINDREYDITDIINMNKKLKVYNIPSNLYRSNWASLWSAKLDYIENQIGKLGTNNIVENSIDYYLGMAENAIYYVNNTNSKYSKEVNLVLSHRRVYYPNISLNYLNPLLFIFDIEVRDIAEYLKSLFFAGEDALIELQTYLKSVRLNNYLYSMLFARLLYPSYYFDLYERIVNKNENEEVLLSIIKKSNNYEKFLKKAYKEISLYAPLENIEWLIFQR